MAFHSPSINKHWFRFDHIQIQANPYLCAAKKTKCDRALEGVKCAPTPRECRYHIFSKVGGQGETSYSYVTDFEWQGCLHSAADRDAKWSCAIAGLVPVAIRGRHDEALWAALGGACAVSMVWRFLLFCRCRERTDREVGSDETIAEHRTQVNNVGSRQVVCCYWAETHFLLTFRVYPMELLPRWLYSRGIQYTVIICNYTGRWW